MTLDADPHPLLDLRALATRWSPPVAPSAELDALAAEAPPPLAEGHADAVRALLRHGGFKPAGRSKPCSEYVRAAWVDGRFPRIDPVVDATNLAVLRFGLPISTIDLDRARAPLRVGLAPAGASYPFNASGQEIRLDGLLCLFDADGPCANAVKDAQRTKTTPATTRTLTLVWGTNALPGLADEVAAWLAGLHARLGGVVE